MENSTTANRAPYTIQSITHCAPPEGAEGDDWYYYVITQGPNVITGYKQGTLAFVTQAVEENVYFLNERQKGRYGRNHITVPSSKR